MGGKGDRRLKKGGKRSKSGVRKEIKRCVIKRNGKDAAHAGRRDFGKRKKGQAEQKEGSDEDVLIQKKLCGEEFRAKNRIAENANATRRAGEARRGND